MICGKPERHTGRAVTHGWAGPGAGARAPTPETCLRWSHPATVPPGPSSGRLVSGSAPCSTHSILLLSNLPPTGLPVQPTGQAEAAGQVVRGCPPVTVPQRLAVSGHIGQDPPQGGQWQGEVSGGAPSQLCAWAWASKRGGQGAPSTGSAQGSIPGPRPGISLPGGLGAAVREGSGRVPVTRHSGGPSCPGPGWHERRPAGAPGLGAGEAGLADIAAAAVAAAESRGSGSRDSRDLSNSGVISSRAHGRPGRVNQQALPGAARCGACRAADRLAGPGRRQPPWRPGALGPPPEAHGCRSSPAEGCDSAEGITRLQLLPSSGRR